MHKIRRVDVTMIHATPGNAQATGEASAPPGSVGGVGPDPGAGRPPDRRRGDLGVSREAGVPAGGFARPERQADAGSPAAPVPHAEASTRAAVDSRTAARRIPDG